TPRLFVSGATHRYLGRQFRLKISVGESPSVRLRGGYFQIETADRTPDAVQRLLDEWFRDKAEAQFRRRIEKWKPWCRRHRLPEPTLALRRMQKRWGSASLSGRITLNPELIHAP